MFSGGPIVRRGSRPREPVEPISNSFQVAFFRQALDHISYGTLAHKSTGGFDRINYLCRGARLGERRHRFEHELPRFATRATPKSTPVATGLLCQGGVKLLQLNADPAVIGLRPGAQLLKLLAGQLGQNRDDRVLHCHHPTTRFSTMM
ncbi:MAG TPA: hypothetical protein VGL37_01715 [Solirubrobacteraceae bacterium]